MTEWQVFLVITVVFGFIVAVTNPITKATRAIVELTTELRVLAGQFKEFKKENNEFKKEASDKHSKIHARIDDNKKAIHDHEVRISVLEKNNSNDDGGN